MTLLNRALLLLPVFMMAFFSLQAQPPGGGRGRGGFGGDPAEMASKQTQQMVDSLMLSTAQAEKVQEVNLKYAKQMQEMRASSNGDWMGMREKMGTIREESAKELAIYLTDEQSAKWIKITENDNMNGGNRGNRGNSEDKGPSDEKRKKGKKKKGSSKGNNNQ